MSELPKVEVYCCFLIWISGVCISLYRLFLVGQVFDHKNHDQYLYEDFKKGWSFLGSRFQDQADSEWNTWSNLVIKLTPFLIINFVGAELIRFRNISLLPLWYVAITISFLLYYFSVELLLFFLAQTLVYIFSIFIKSYFLIWVISFVIIHSLKPELWFVSHEDDQYLVVVASSWMVLRCISYSVDTINSSLLSNKGYEFSSALNFLAYSFYLPTMFFGPFISFHYFDEGVKSREHSWSYSRIARIIMNFFKCGMWFVFTLFALHFIYVNAILLRPGFVRNLLDWELAGLGIAMGHFFHLKYIVFYGIPCAWASAEGYKTPKLPCCVSRVHLYSYMWRWFDHGLYQFLIRYIYIPIVSNVKGNNVARKITASIICFIFIFIWHGEQDYVFFWVLFNYIALTMELVVKQSSKMSFVKKFLDQNFTRQNQIRLQCLVAAPLHCFSMISNYFFIGNGVEIGFIYLKRVYYGSLQCKLTILFFLYGAGHSAVATQKWEVQREKEKKLKTTK